MKPIPEDLKKVAEKVVWFKPPSEALRDSVYFLCCLMQYGTDHDIKIAKHYFDATAFVNALTHAYPGIMDARSWAYWNLNFRNDAFRAQPKRFL